MDRSEVAMVSRRHLFRLATALGLGGLLPSPRAAANPRSIANVPPLSPTSASSLGAQARAVSGTVAIEPDVYKAIGVRPLINCRGTLTIIGGSIELPEVRAAKNAANQQHAQIDEVMEAVGARLAELTGAEWGMVSAGCAAAMSHHRQGDSQIRPRTGPSTRPGAGPSAGLGASW